MLFFRRRRRSFFCVQEFYEAQDLRQNRKTATGRIFSEIHKKENTSSETEVNILRTRITLACTECKQRNYSTTKDKKVMPDRMEIKKYCKFCKAHTLHKETK